MRLSKHRVFWIVLPAATGILTLCALYPVSALSILSDFVLPALGALLILHGAWRAGGWPLGLLALALLLTIASVVVERYAAGTILSVTAGAAVDLSLQVGALVSLIAALVTWIKGEGFRRVS